jgi:ketosteroid isomerase-like protein
MSQENVELVVGLFENVNKRNFQAIMDAYADDMVLVNHGELRAASGPGVVGKEAVGAWFGDWFRSFDRDYRFEIEETRDLGDRVLIVARHRSRGRASGAPIDQHGAWIYTVRDGRVVRCDIYSERTAALEAVGLSE